MIASILMLNDVADDLRQWSVETGEEVPLPVHEVIHVEACGAVVDLVSGLRFYVHDEWLDFATRHMWVVIAKGQHPTVDRLASAIERANEYGWRGQVCRSIALVTLKMAMQRVCTVQF